MDTGRLIDDGTSGLTRQIIGAAMAVHRAMGPGLLESAYEAFMVEELRCRSLTVATQVPVPAIYRSVRLDCGFRMDLLVEQTVIVELKVARKLKPVHRAQLLTYLRCANLRVGLLFNFNVEALAVGGFKRVLNGF